MICIRIDSGVSHLTTELNNVSNIRVIDYLIFKKIGEKFGHENNNPPFAFSGRYDTFY